LNLLSNKKLKQEEPVSFDFLLAQIQEFKQKYDESLGQLE